jgi:RNA polymerase sigma-70 factor, ECF subfamily
MDRSAVWETEPVRAVAGVMGEIDQGTAFARLVDRHLDEAFRLATVIFGGDRMEAEDAVQEAAVRAWRHLGDLRDEERFASWFTRIVVNACRDRLRVRRLRAIDPVGLEQGAVPDHGTAVDETDALVRALQELPTDQRIVVALRYFEDCSLEEIATRTGERTGTVKSRLHYGLRALRAALDAEAREMSR